MNKTMTVEAIKQALQTANLSQLSRDSGVDLRTLRRLKNGHVADILLSTALELSKHLQPEPTTRGKK